MTSTARPKQPLVVGLTGGIGSGKTTVANAFAAMGVPLIDADVIARELAEPGQPVFDRVRDLFGDECLTAQGRLDRACVRQRIFADDSLRHQLEAILHPEIFKNIRNLIKKVESPYCIVVIPLLLESGEEDLVERILVVDAPEEEQIRRVAVRDQLSENAIQKIMNSQADRKSRLAAADDIIVNDSDLERLMRQIRTLHLRYLELSNDD